MQPLLVFVNLVLRLLLYQSPKETAVSVRQQTVRYLGQFPSQRRDGFIGSSPDYGQTIDIVHTIQYRRDKWLLRNKYRELGQSHGIWKQILWFLLFTNISMTTVWEHFSAISLVWLYKYQYQYQNMNKK